MLVDHTDTLVPSTPTQTHTGWFACLSVRVCAMCLLISASDAHVIVGEHDKYACVCVCVKMDSEEMCCVCDPSQHRLLPGLSLNHFVQRPRDARFLDDASDSRSRKLS